ncbi:MAG: RsmD family RNA methyltransferase [Flavobacteriales bacterium]|nr:RsmD family RNA methyltransferase [Flavobacteriales bacterium]
MKQAVSEFISKHEAKSVSEVALLLSKNETLPKDFILNQINGRQKAKQKFPLLVTFPNFVYPSARAVSQSSSEKTANYKASIIPAKTVADLSGGMGLDSYFFSKQAQQSHYIEIDHDLAEITAQNFKTLTAKNIHVHNTEAIHFLRNTNEQFELVYIDPDRRATKEKAFRINECEPNVAKMIPLIWKKSSLCLIKLSPMLDISQALEELPNCKEVHVVSVDNECKEILFLLQKNFKGEPSIQCVNLKKNEKQNFTFTTQEEKDSFSSFSKPLDFLYEPNASIMKAGAFKRISELLNIAKLETNTHLYTSTDLIKDFPGRTIKILDVSKPKKGLTEKANVVCRNFSQSPDAVKKKYKIKDGGTLFLYATTLEKKEKVFILGELV